MEAVGKYGKKVAEQINVVNSWKDLKEVKCYTMIKKMIRINTYSENGGIKTVGKQKTDLRNH